MLDQIAEVIGEEAALRLSYRFRGQLLYIRKHYPDAHPLVTEIGREAADKLIAVYGGERQVYIPEDPGIRWAVLKLDARGNLTRQEIADNVRIGERRVYRIIDKARKAKAEAMQGNLFTHDMPRFLRAH